MSSAAPRGVGCPTRRFPWRAAWSVALVVAIVASLIAFLPDVVHGVAFAARRIGAAGFAIYVAYSIGVFALLGASWWVTTDEPPRRIALFVRARLVREATADFLPFSQVGGIVFGVRAVSTRGVPAATAYASFVADLMAEIGSQLVFTGFGVALAFAVLGTTASALPATTLSVGAVALAGLAAVLLSAPTASAPAERLARRLLPEGAGAIDAWGASLRRVYGRRDRLVASFALNLAAWAASALGAAIVLALMRFDVSVARVVALESLIFLVRSTAFAIPAGLGVQEAAYAVIGPAFGLSTDALVALDVAKRLRDAAIALPVLAAWQVGELRDAFRARTT